MLPIFDNLIMVGYEMRDIDGIFRTWLIDLWFADMCFCGFLKRGRGTLFDTHAASMLADPSLYPCSLFMDVRSVILVEKELL